MLVLKRDTFYIGLRTISERQSRTNKLNENYSIDFKS